MNPIARRLAHAIVLGALALRSAGARAQPPVPVPQPAPSAGQASVITSCSVVPPGGVRGFVTNATNSDFSIVGAVRFQFPQSQAPGTAVQAQAHALVPMGQTVMVVETTLPFTAPPGTPCVFVVDDAVRGRLP